MIRSFTCLISTLLYCLMLFFFKVFARDQDGSSVNRKVVFRIQHGAQDKFVMEADTGVISVAQGALLDPDRTEPRATTYILEVIALDGGIGNAQLQARTVVNITILDVNNKPPIFIDPGIVRCVAKEEKKFQSSVYIAIYVLETSVK